MVLETLKGLFIGNSSQKSASGSESRRTSANGKGKKRARADVEVIDDDDAPNGARARPAEGITCSAEESLAYDKMIADYERNARRMNEAYNGRKVSKEETEKLVGTVMRTLLFKCTQQRGVPVPRTELTSLVTKKYAQQGKKGFTNLVMSRAQANFAKGMGLEMAEVTRTNPDGTESSSKWYVLRSMLPRAVRSALVFEDASMLEERAVTLVILMALALSGDQLAEDKLWELLSSLGIERGAKHAIFGDPEQMITRLLRQKYIHKVTQNAGNNSAVYYTPGENAVGEVKPATLNEAISAALKLGAGTVKETIELSE